MRRWISFFRVWVGRTEPDPANSNDLTNDQVDKMKTTMFLSLPLFTTAGRIVSFHARSRVCLSILIQFFGKKQVEQSEFLLTRIISWESQRMGAQDWSVAAEQYPPNTSTAITFVVSIVHVLTISTVYIISRWNSSDTTLGNAIATQWNRYFRTIQIQAGNTSLNTVILSVLNSMNFFGIFVGLHLDFVNFIVPEPSTPFLHMSRLCGQMWFQFLSNSPHSMVSIFEGGYNSIIDWSSCLSSRTLLFGAITTH